MINFTLLDQYWYGKSLREDKAKAIQQHIDSYGSEWRTTAADYNDDNIKWLSSNKTEMDSFLTLLMSWWNGINNNDIPLVIRTDDGRYLVVTTANYYITKVPPEWCGPVFYVQPESQIINLGGGTLLETQSTFTTSCQWYFAGAKLTGETDSALEIFGFKNTDVGNYYCESTSVHGEVGYSNVISLTLPEPEPEPEPEGVV